VVEAVTRIDDADGAPDRGIAGSECRIDGLDVRVVAQEAQRLVREIDRRDALALQLAHEAAAGGIHSKARLLRWPELDEVADFALRVAIGGNGCSGVAASWERGRRFVKRRGKCYFS